MSWAASRTVIRIRAKPAQQRDDLGDAADIETGKRFVQQQQAGTPDQGMRDDHPLLLTAGQVADSPVGETRRIHGIEHLIDLCATPLRGDRKAQSVAVESERNKVPRAHRHVGIEHEFLRHIADRSQPAAAGDRDAAPAERDEAKDGAQQRRFA